MQQYIHMLSTYHYSLNVKEFLYNFPECRCSQSISRKGVNSIYINYQVSIYLTVVQLNPNEGALLNANRNSYGFIACFLYVFLNGRH